MVVVVVVVVVVNLFNLLDIIIIDSFLQSFLIPPFFSLLLIYRILPAIKKARTHSNLNRT